MSTFSLQLKAVYSQAAAEVPGGVRLPEGWRLRWHQAETYAALSDPEVEVVINTAMTGDGKSLAAYLRALSDRDKVLGLYPTNELARDQERQIQGYVDQFNPVNDPRVNRWSGAELELFAKQENLRKADAIESRSFNSEILLSNPDIFHYLHQGAYLIPGQDVPDKLWGRVDQKFNYFVFDEFHVFSPPQVAGVLNTMLLIRHTKSNQQHRKKFLFLSATPDEQLCQKLDRAGFRYRLIDPTAEEKYQFPATVAEGDRLVQAGWREVMRAIDLHFVALEPTAQASEAWLKENIDSILQPFLERPGSKGAIILNSIAAVKRLVPLVKARFLVHGLTVGENTGLSGQKAKLASLAADLVIGTSTIDIGVDFKINLLWFEAADAGNFIQRLGRLGRHDRNELGEPFVGFTAWAIVPNFLMERLFQAKDAPLQVQMECDRPRFHAAIRSAYYKINDFRGYYRKWAAIQSLKLWLSLEKSEIKANYAQARDLFKTDCEQVFGMTLNEAQGKARGWAKEWAELSGKKGNPIADEAASFRGSSPLLCGLYDLTEPHEGDRFKTYDLPGILGNLEIEMWTEAGFMRQLAETRDRLGVPIAQDRFKHCLGFMKLLGYREERLNWRLTYPGSLAEVASANQVRVLAGLQVWQPDNRWVGALNRQLQQQGLVCYVLPYPVAVARQRLRLPMHFALYPIADEGCIHTATPPYAIAIGQAALLVDTLSARLKSQGDEIWIS